jgi:hypothetical protein
MLTTVALFAKKIVDGFQDCFRFNPNKPRCIPKIWPKPETQIGGTCGLYALYIALIYSVMSESENLLISKVPNPIHTTNNPTTNSLLAIAQKNGLSHTGEIFNIDYFETISQKAGFSAKKSIRSNHKDFISDLCKQIDDRNTVIVSCDINNDSFPDKNDGGRAHWVLAFGYGYVKEEIFFLVTQHGKYFLFSGEAFLASNNQNGETVLSIPGCPPTNFTHFYFTLFPIPTTRIEYNEATASDEQHIEEKIT